MKLDYPDKLLDEFALDLYMQAAEDISDFITFSNYIGMSVYILGGKKSPSCHIRKLEKWHPTCAVGAFDLLLPGPIRSMYQELLGCNIVDTATISAYNYIYRFAKQIPHPGLSLELYVMGNKVNNKNLSKRLVDQIAALTEQSQIVWTAEPSEGGCCPEFVNEDRRHISTYTSGIIDMQNKGLELTLSLYEETKRVCTPQDGPEDKITNRAYREYILKVVEIENYGSILEGDSCRSNTVRGAGKIWKILNSKLNNPGKPTNTAKELPLDSACSFLQGFLDCSEDQQKG